MPSHGEWEAGVAHGEALVGNLADDVGQQEADAHSEVAERGEGERPYSPCASLTRHPARPAHAMRCQRPLRSSRRRPRPFPADGQLYSRERP